MKSTTSLKALPALLASVLLAFSPVLISTNASALGGMPVLIAQADFAPDLNSVDSGAGDTMASDYADIPDSELVAAAPVRRHSAPARTAPSRSSTTRQAPIPAHSRAAAPRGDSDFARANKLAASGQYQEASKLLFAMARNPQYAANSAQIKYVLALMLFEMKLNQSSAFVFYDLIRQESKANSKSKYIRQSLNKVALAANSLDSDVLLRYAIKQVDENDFPAANRDMFYFRTGELKMEEKNYQEAARQFSRVHAGSLFFTRARYNMGLALAEGKDLEKAQAVFEDLAERTQRYGITDRQRVSALLGRARVLYQRKQFASAIEAYRDVPRDTDEWHEALFESSWAMLQDGRFRSALSNFHTLHSPYYEDYYQPESLLLRAIVYLYICRYEEMAKVLDLFDRVYKPVAHDIHTALATGSDEMLYKELARVRDNYDAIRTQKYGRRSLTLPFSVARMVLGQGDVRRTFNYLANLEDERKRITQLPIAWKSSGIGIYSAKIVEKRLEATRILAGKQIRRHLVIMENELRDLFEQTGFLRFEMLNSKREALKKEIQGKGLAKVDESTDRSFYIQNGYEYWPFKGEYWLDEIGNYHYVGVQACE